MGAAKQASLLPEDYNTSDLNENVGLRALNYDIVFTSNAVETGDGNNENEPIVLISRNNPIPVRRSYHLSMTGKDSISVKVFLRAGNQEMKELIEVSNSMSALWEISVKCVQKLFLDYIRV